MTNRNTERSTTDLSDTERAALMPLQTYLEGLDHDEIAARYAAIRKQLGSLAREMAAIEAFAKLESLNLPPPKAWDGLDGCITVPENH